MGMRQGPNVCMVVNQMPGVAVLLEYLSLQQFWYVNELIVFPPHRAESVGTHSPSNISRDEDLSLSTADIDLLVMLEHALPASEHILVTGKGHVKTWLDGRDVVGRRPELSHLI